MVIGFTSTIYLLNIHVHVHIVFQLLLATLLSTCQTELELARKNAERMAKTNPELADLQQEKEDIEDDKHCLEIEMSAGRERLQGLKVHA